MLRSAVAAAATVFEESSYEPWALVLPEGYEDTVVDLKKANDAVVVRLKNARDTSKGCFGLRSVESSRSEIHLVGLVFEYLMWSRLGRLNICLNPCLLTIALAVAPPYHCEILERGNAIEVRNPLQLLHPSGYSKMTSHFYAREQGSTLTRRILKLP